MLYRSVREDGRMNVRHDGRIPLNAPRVSVTLVGGAIPGPTTNLSQ
jgi:hypothetical protein